MLTGTLYASLSQLIILSLNLMGFGCFSPLTPRRGFFSSLIDVRTFPARWYGTYWRSGSCLPCSRYARECHRPNPDKLEDDTCSWCARLGISCYEETGQPTDYAEVRQAWNDVAVWANYEGDMLNDNLSALQALRGMQRFYTDDELKCLADAMNAEDELKMEEDD